MESETDTDLAVHGSGNDGTYVRQALTSARMVPVMMEHETGSDLGTHDSGDDET